MVRKKIDLDWVIKNHLSFFQELGMTEKNIRKHYDQWKIGKDAASVNDYYWHILQNVIYAINEQVSSEEQVYKLNYEAYYKMWEFLVYVERKNGNHVKKTMLENQLRAWYYRSTKFKVQVVIVSGSCCSFCDQLNGKHISFEEALDKQYLASSECTNIRGCNCIYATINCRDGNGRLIRIV